jgi:protein-S-isoprenylcysteine O-methyltransferase Ste14
MIQLNEKKYSDERDLTNKNLQFGQNFFLNLIRLILIKMCSYQQLISMALARFIPGIIIVSALLFIPAGTLRFWNAWIFMGVLFIPMLFVIVYLITRDPELLFKRMNTNEKENTQKKVVLLTSIIFLSAFIISGLDFRFHWSKVPLLIVILSAIVVMAGYILFFMVMRQNSYASRVVEIQEKQKVIDSGLYSIVRHPMYSSAILMFMFMPLVLGSFFALIPLVIFPFQMSTRMKNEELILEEGLEGYIEYKKKVKYKIIPFFW